MVDYIVESFRKDNRCMGIHGYPLEIQVTFLELGSLSEENRDGDFYIFYLDVKHVLISKCSFR